MHHRRRCLTGRLALASALLLLPATLSAQRTLVVESFDSELQVQRTGDVVVTETIRARFQGSWNGIFRDLSLAHQTAEGRQERLDVDLESATDDQGQDLRVEVDNRGRWTRRFEIWVPDANDATRTVILRYVVHNAIRYFSEDSEFGHMDELYWNATGNDWEIPIEQASVRFVLPDAVTPIQSSGYTGFSGSTDQDVDITTSGNVVTFTATRGFQPGEGLTAASGWQAGVVTRPSQASRTASRTTESWPLALPLLAFFFSFREWRRKGRDPEPRSIAVQYEPPTGLGPTETGTLIDHKADMHDVTATLVDLAVRGFVHIEKVESKKLGLFSSTDYTFHHNTPREVWGALTEPERLYLTGVFRHAGAESFMGQLASFVGVAEEEPRPGAHREGTGEGPTFESVPMSALKNSFYKDLPGIRKAVYARLVQQRHYSRSPEAVKTRWTAAGLGMGVAGVAGAVWASQSGAAFVSPALLGGGAVAGAVILLVFSRLMPARTVQGARSREAAMGFKEFLERVEEDRYRRMITSPEMFERFLPYAMAFQVEKKWARAFEDMLTDPPRWYSGHGAGRFHASEFTSDLGDLTSAAASTMASSPSGSGGGGSSGGGSGGGGGGGF
jgi:uncharacterized membrane protein YgcG